MDKKYRHEEWSCYKYRDEIDGALAGFRYPSTTIRCPRSIKELHLFKGNEFRILTLFGFIAFESYMLPEHYTNLQCFATAMHLAEASSLHIDECNQIDELLRHFLFSFPYLYTIRHNVQVIHSMAHISTTVIDFGPLQNYSTFNYESCLGE